jgi:hypothetical protein
MLSEMTAVEQKPGAPLVPSLELIVAMGLATLIAPLAAPASILIVLGLANGGIGTGLFALALAPLSLLTVPGLYGYAMAFPAVSVLGTVLTQLTLTRGRLRPVRIWAAIGALSGMLIAAALVPIEPVMFMCGAAAGGSCAFVYRLIIARPLAAHRSGGIARDCPKPQAELD